MPLRVSTLRGYFIFMSDTNNNTGKRNTGNWNTGNWNTGDYNTGYSNTGDCNTGYYNTGYYNTGNCNTGYYNTGYCNTGNWNTGDYNTGNCNTGYYNTGYCNTGNWNTGDYNTGKRNTGNWNKTNHSTGFFNTKEQPLYMFNKLVEDVKREDVDTFLDIKLTEWILPENMTEQEKKDNPSWETCDGYLKERTFEEACVLAWQEASEETKNKFLNLPNFDADIFFEITSIDVRKPRKIKIDGEYTKEELEKILERF
jgi:hypothetical protein